MKLFINDNCNISALKIISVSEFFGLNIDVINENGPSHFNKLPVFLTADGCSYFSTNASCRYLQKTAGDAITYETESWLEWESTVLQPSLSLQLKASKGEVALVYFKNSLSYLNALLEKQKYIAGNESPNLPDIIIWANLNPLSKASLLGKASDFIHVQRWLVSLNSHTTLDKAFSSVFGDVKEADLKKRLMCSFSNVSENVRFFTPVTVPKFCSEIEIESEKPVNDLEQPSKASAVTVEEMQNVYRQWLKGKSALPALKKKEIPILPRKGDRNVLITSALPYVNNVPHLGNIIGSVLSADVFARYCRLREYNILYICGTDEYGTATETKAIELGMTPKEICDKYNQLHSEIYNWFNISFDLFGRTTTSQQTEIAQDIFKKLYDQNLMLIENVEQLYCGSCERFLADRFVEGICPFCLYEDARGDQCDKCGKLINAPDLKNPQCKLCKSTPHMRSSKHLFLDLPKLEPSLKKYLDEATTEGNWSNTAKVIAYAWLKEGLKPRCITRDLKWGTPVPLEGFTDKVFYVWFDAPIGYLSITANYTAEWEKWWKQPDIVQLYQFMAKDNVPFHAIVFPACQIGTKDNYTIVNHLSATEYLNYEDVKFSKSRGVGVFGDDAKDTGIPSDIWRFYLLYIRPEAQDTFFSWNDLMLKVNSELLNNIGNFINRGLSFLSNFFGGIVPEMSLGDGEKTLIAEVDSELKSYISCMEKLRLRDGIKSILSISRIGNQFIQANKPWELVKGTSSEKAVAGTVIGLSVNISCLLCTLMEPYMPDTCANLKVQLNTEPLHHILINDFVCLLPSGHKIGKPIPLFKKIDQDTINELKAKYAGRQSPVKEEVEKASKKQKDAINGLDKDEIESLNELVTAQADKVRQLKANKVAKSEIDKEVSTLLELKKRLAVAKGENPDQTLNKSKSKKKK